MGEGIGDVAGLWGEWRHWRLSGAELSDILAKGRVLYYSVASVRATFGGLVPVLDCWGSLFV